MSWWAGLTVVAPRSFQSYVMADVDTCVAVPTWTSHLVWVSTQWPAVRTTFGAMRVAEQRYSPVAVMSMLRYAASGYWLASVPPTMGSLDAPRSSPDVGAPEQPTTVPARAHIQAYFIERAPRMLMGNGGPR